MSPKVKRDGSVGLGRNSFCLPYMKCTYCCCHCYQEERQVPWNFVSQISDLDQTTYHTDYLGH